MVPPVDVAVSGVCVAKRRVIKARRSDVAVRLLAKCFLLLVGVLVYHQCDQTKQHHEKLRTTCAARGGKLALSDLCISLSWGGMATGARSRKAARPNLRLEAASE